MKYLISFIVPIFLYSNAFSQQVTASTGKPPLQLESGNNWASVGSEKISNDGKYIVYFVDNLPVGHTTLFVYSVSNGTEIKIIEASGYSTAFANNGRNLLFMKGKDSLGILDLEKESIKYITGISSYSMLEGSLDRNFIFFRIGQPQTLNLFDIVTGEQTEIDSVKHYWCLSSANALLLEKDTLVNRVHQQSLITLSLNNGTEKQVWSGFIKEGSIQDKHNGAIAFIAERNPEEEPSLMYYKCGMTVPVNITHEKNLGFGTEYIFKNLAGFSKDGNNIYYTVKRAPQKEIRKSGVSVDVWSYVDEKLPSVQLNNEKSGEESFPAIIHINDRSAYFLFETNDQLYYQPDNNNYVLISNYSGDPVEWNWNKSSVAETYLVSLNNGKRVLINQPGGRSYQLSIGERYVVYYDTLKKDYFSYEISTGTSRNITKGIKADWSRRNDEPDSSVIPYLPWAGFTEGDSSVILYDQNDIFEADLRGRKDPINLTNGYGRRYKIYFRLLFPDHDQALPNQTFLYLNAFEKSTKQNGFYSIRLGVAQQPTKISMQDYMFAGTEEDTHVHGFRPIKAKHAEIYLVKRMEASESPNLFWTKDFRNFKRVSSVFPERQYNWYTTSLLRWKTFDGDSSQGILYKPENFDPSHKYPVILFYYERNSAGLHGYLKPEYSDGQLNIPWYVSNGYLVFVPDIYYKVGYPGRSAFNSVVSAASYLKTFQWVDETRLGLQGHSFGGFETNYIITHTDIFKAACSASGMTDFISAYGAITGDGSSRAKQYEYGRDRIGSPLSVRPDLYIENSPVLLADKVQTPVLMLADKEDGDVPCQQGFEFFTSLRRWGKKAWLLQYDGQGHTLDGDASVDFTIRMTQFFDHYLKDQPAPEWMTKGIPEDKKRIDTGFGIDPQKVTPGPGLLIQ